VVVGAGTVSVDVVSVCPKAFTKPTFRGKRSMARRITGNGMAAPP
jgi:hypothetical protein